MACACLLLMAASTGARAFAISSIASTDWQTATTWSILPAPPDTIPGTITTNTGSKTVTGVGTGFTVLQAGDSLLTTADVLIGTVASVTSATQLTLTANATATLSASAYHLQKVPGAADDVSISHATNVTINSSLPSPAKALSLTFVGASTSIASSSLTHAAGVPLAIGGDVNVNSPSANNGTNRSWNINAGSATVAGNVSLSQSSANNARIAQINLTSGPAPNAVLDIKGNLTFTASNAVRVVINMAGGTGDGTINLAGIFNPPANGTLAMGAGAAVFNFNGTVAQTVPIGVSSVIYRNLHLNNAAGATLSAAITAANVTGNVRVQGGIFNNGGFAIASAGGGDVFEVANGALFNLAGTSAMASGFTTFTFGPTSTVSFQGRNQTIAAGLTYGHLILDGTAASTKTMGTAAAQTITVAGNFTVQGTTTTYAGNTFSPAVNLAGNFTNSATTFNSGTGTYTFNGAATTAQTLTGVTTFTNMAVNNTGTGATAGLSLASSVTVGTAAAGVLTLTSGDITTGANAVIVETAGTIATPSASSYVVGNFQKNYVAGDLSYFAGNNFPVGDATNFTPVNISAVTTTTAGSLTVSTFTPDHPQVATPIRTTGIDAARSVNRYWRFANSGLTIGTAMTAKFTFVAADRDNAADTSSYIVERYDGTNWNPTIAGTPNSLDTTASNITPLVTGNNDFAIGVPLAGFTAVPGRYNVFETATTAGAIIGKIQTKVAGTGFSVDVVNINTTKTGVLAGSITVEVRLLDSSGGGVLDVNGCNAAWPLIQALPNFAIPASGRGTIPLATVTNSYRSVRFQIRSPVGGPYTQIGCSTDLFAIRPASLTITAYDATWATAGTTRTLANITASGGNVHKAATSASPLPFTLRATPLPATATNYDGNPTTVAGFPTCGTLCTTVGGLSFTAGSWTAGGSGVRENATANYSEAGTFNLKLEDATYASVDAVDGTPLATLTVPAAASVQIGRFIPDHFAITTNNVPKLKTFNNAACAVRSFTYVGQPFGYVTAPQVLVTAQNAGNITTTNYSLTLWKLATAAGTQDCTTNPDICTLTSGSVTQTYTYTTTPAATPNWDSAQVALATPTIAANNNGTGTVTSASTDLLVFKRSATPLALFTASIALTDSVKDTSEYTTGVGNCGVAGAGGCDITTLTSAAFNPVAFDSGNEFRYGRVKLSNAYGSELLDLPVPMIAQYWNGSWLTDTLDTCTTGVSLSRAVVSGGMTVDTSKACAWDNGTPPGLSGIGCSTTSPGKAFAMPPGVGNFNLNLKASGAGNPGAMDLSASVPPWLQYNWKGAGNANPTARATFGVYGAKSPIIYRRENY